VKKTVFYIFIALIALAVLYVGVKSFFPGRLSDNGDIDLGGEDSTLKYKAIEESDLNLGVIKYPNSEYVITDSFSGEVITESGVTMVGTYKTSDPVDKVLEYFKDQLGSGYKTAKINDGETDMTVLGSSDSSAPIVEIYDENGLTYIKIIKR
jgi:hypothetical protein